MPAPRAVEPSHQAFYDGIAGDYDRLLDNPRARGMRACFWQRAAALLPPHARILDFGAGTGIDAEHFAGLGHKVTAYDPSAGMLAALKRRCAALVAAERVVPVSGALDQAAPALAAHAPYDAVVCNFAVFSAIPDLDEVFRLFGALVRPGGAALICIQNPWWPEEMRTRSFWRALLAMPLAGVIRYSSGQSGFSYRHTPRQVRRTARPEFRPERGPQPPCCQTRFGWRSRMRLVALRRR